VTAVTIAVAEMDVVYWVVYRQAIISVVDNVVFEQHVRALNTKTYQMVG